MPKTNTARANGAVIRALREKGDLSQAQLARMAGFRTHSHLSAIERNEKPISVRALHRIARALGVPVGAIKLPDPGEDAA